MSLYTSFTNEDDFRERFIRPLLNRLGFLRVANLHGPQEFGKDFVFSEVNRFGLYRHYAAQAKHEQVINQGRKIDDLAAQITQAFTKPFTLPDSPRECFVSAVYVFNSGNITANACEQLVARLRTTIHADNVVLLDGDRLEAINRWGFRQLSEDVRGRLTGLRRQLEVNLYFWKFSLDAAQKQTTVNLRGSMLHGIEEFITRPVSSDRIPLDDLVTLWEDARLIDAACARLMAPINLQAVSDDARSAIILVTKRAIPRAEQLLRKIDAILSEFGPL
jgi:hypothetical protein